MRKWESRFHEICTPAGPDLPGPFMWTGKGFIPRRPPELSEWKVWFGLGAFRLLIWVFIIIIINLATYDAENLDWREYWRVKVDTRNQLVNPTVVQDRHNWGLEGGNGKRETSIDGELHAEVWRKRIYQRSPRGLCWRWGIAEQGWERCYRTGGRKRWQGESQTEALNCHRFSHLPFLCETWLSGQFVPTGSSKSPLLSHLWFTTWLLNGFLL